MQRARMLRRRRGGKLKWDQWVRDFLRENARFHRHVLRELERHGPLLSRDLERTSCRRASDTAGGATGRCA